MLDTPAADLRVDDIRSAFSLTGRPLPDQRARRLAEELITYGGLEAAIAALAHDDAWQVLADALAYGAARAELSDPALFIARLRQEARDLDARAEPAWAEAAEFQGRAAFRRSKGQTDLADQFLARALAAERFAITCEDQALAKRLQAAGPKAAANLDCLSLWAA